MEGEPREVRKPKAWVVYGGPGHEREYVFSVEQLRGTNQVPADIADTVESELGAEGDVAYRGTRIEVIRKKPYGARDDQKVNAAFKRALGDGYNFIPAR